MQENSLIEWLRVNAKSSPHLVTGIGDDAAVLRPPKTNMVVTTDLICDGTHFILNQSTPAQIGRKAMAVNLSDIAAMAARPVAAFVSLLLPRGTDETFARNLMQAAAALGREFDCEIAGGDTNVHDGKLAVNVLIIGETTERGPLLRSGATEGDVLLVTGTLGHSIAGKHFDFTPRIEEALLLHDRYQITAAMDLSDGLALDVRRLCEASSCGAEIYADSLPISDAVKEVSATEADAAGHQIERALGDGEDFELLFTLPQNDATKLLSEQPLSVPVARIGHCTAEQTLWLTRDGNRQPLPMLGYEHGNER